MRSMVVLCQNNNKEGEVAAEKLAISQDFCISGNHEV